MKFKEVARNLVNEGMAYKWGWGRLVGWKDPDPTNWTFCALGIKAIEGGVPPVVLAFYEMVDPRSLKNFRTYSAFKGLERVYNANDEAGSREEAAYDLALEEGEADIEGWVSYLKGLLPEAVAWAEDRGYNSLLRDLPKGT